METLAEGIHLISKNGMKTEVQKIQIDFLFQLGTYYIFDHPFVAVNLKCPQSEHMKIRMEQGSFLPVRIDFFCSSFSINSLTSPLLFERVLPTANPAGPPQFASKQAL